MSPSGSLPCDWAPVLPSGGTFAVGKTFNELLAWDFIDNRPFLRCLHGVGLCWWRLAKTREASAAFRKML